MAAPKSRAADNPYSPFPAPAAGQVTDLANLLNDTQRRSIEQRLAQHERDHGAQIRVLTIRALADYHGTPNSSIEQFAMALFNRWQIGRLPQNDGVLLLVSVNDRKARIELGAAYARARNASAQRIIDSVLLPRFRAGSFAQGIVDGADAIMKEFDGRMVPTGSAEPAASGSPRSASPPIPYTPPGNSSPAFHPGVFLGPALGGLVCVAMAIFAVIAVLVGVAQSMSGDTRRRRWYDNGYSSGFWSDNSSSGSSHFDSGSSFSGGGDGGGGGGGSSDGGGASGGW